MKTNVIILLTCACIFLLAWTFRSTPSLPTESLDQISSKIDYFSSVILPVDDFDLMIWISLPRAYCGRCWLHDDEIIELIRSLPERKIGIGLLVGSQHEYNVRTLLQHDLVLEVNVREEFTYNTYYIYADNEGHILNLHENTHSDFEEAITNLRMLYTLMKLHGYQPDEALTSD